MTPGSRLIDAAELTRLRAERDRLLEDREYALKQSHGDLAEIGALRATLRREIIRRRQTEIELEQLRAIVDRARVGASLMWPMALQARENAGEHQAAKLPGWEYHVGVSDTCKRIGEWLDRLFS